MIYESVNIINEITQCEITSFLFSSKTKLITLSTNSDYCLNFLKNSILYMPISVTNGIVYQNSLFSWEDQSIISTSLMSFEMKSHPFSIKVAKHENYADSRIFHFFKEDEIITVSCIYQTDNWPVYILGSSLGSILVVPFKPNQEVILYCYHKDAITCIYMSKKKLITCSADSLMCI